MAVLSPVQAADEEAKTDDQKVKFTPQITVGEFQAGEEKEVSGNTIGEYIVAIYTYAIGAVGILAALFVVIGGVQWLTSAGNPEKISEAKARIIASLSGLVLILCSYLLLTIINPDLITFRSINTQINLPPSEGEETINPNEINCSPCDENITNSQKYNAACLTEEQCNKLSNLGYYCNYGSKGKCDVSEITTCSEGLTFCCKSTCCENITNENGAE